jgi:hypothetical protein
MIGVLGMLGYGQGWHEQCGSMLVISRTLGGVAIVGELVGALGLALGRFRDGTVSPSSLVGATMCLIQMYIFVFQFILMTFY